MKTIGILTSGGDCCGLNAVIESVVRTAVHRGYRVIGFKRGYDGLLENDFEELTIKRVRNCYRVGGSILGNSNKTNLFNYNVNGTYTDVSDKAIENLKQDDVYALIIVGGDGSMTSARDFSRKGVNVVCVPKTIDNDVPYTDQTFGYDTAVTQIAKALEGIRTTGSSHERIMVLEVMGRNAGWLALEGGLSAKADVILIPEIPFDINKVAEKLVERYNKGHKTSVICISEGAKPIGGTVVATINTEYPDSVKLGGIGARFTQDLETIIRPITGQEVRNTNLGYIQRGGDTSSRDIVLSFEYGSHAVLMIDDGDFAKMIALKSNKLVRVPLTDVVGNGPMGETSKGGTNVVSKDSSMLETAKLMGIYFGD